MAVYILSVIVVVVVVVVVVFVVVVVAAAAAQPFTVPDDSKRDGDCIEQLAGSFSNLTI